MFRMFRVQCKVALSVARMCFHALRIHKRIDDVRNEKWTANENARTFAREHYDREMFVAVRRECQSANVFVSVSRTSSIAVRLCLRVSAECARGMRCSLPLASQTRLCMSWGRTHSDKCGAVWMSRN